MRTCFPKKLTLWIILKNFNTVTKLKKKVNYE